MPLTPRRTISVSEMREEIIRLIDNNQEVIYKIAFYSQQEVQGLLGEVMKRWERNNYEGRPIDYATDEEVVVLYKIAKKISSMKPEVLYRMYGRDYIPH